MPLPLWSHLLLRACVRACVHACVHAGALAAEVLVFLLCNTMCALYLRARIRRDGRWFEALEGDADDYGHEKNP
eukprot:COSAG01_NODE_424_length_17253_cov_31.601900_12_plen_74_part_00